MQFPDVSRSKLQQDPVSLELENLEETFRTGKKKTIPRTLHLAVPALCEIASHSLKLEIARHV